MHVEEDTRIKNSLEKIDFSKVINKLVAVDGWLLKDAVDTSEQYRKFLFLKCKYANMHDIPPSHDIDLFWHAHILDTKAYWHDCEQLLGQGGYLNHYPYFSIDQDSNQEDLHKAYDITCDLYLKNFGTKISATRSRFSPPIYFLVKKISNIFKVFSRCR